MLVVGNCSLNQGKALTSDPESFEVSKPFSYRFFCICSVIYLQCIILSVEVSSGIHFYRQSYSSTVISSLRNQPKRNSTESSAFNHINILGHIKSGFGDSRRKRSVLTEMDALYSQLQHKRLQRIPLFLSTSQLPRLLALLNHFYSFTQTQFTHIFI